MFLPLFPQKSMFSVGDLFLINSLSAEDAMAQLQLSTQEMVRVSIYGGYDPLCIDVEGTIEFCRLCVSQKKWATPVLPIDYGACMRVQNLGAPMMEIELSHPFLEKGIMRPLLVEKIIEDMNIPIWAGGSFSSQDHEILRSWGVHRIINYRIET